MKTKISDGLVFVLIHSSKYIGDRSASLCR